ncbi:MAG: T9SS type A sorting domain-containing protein [Bacteroidales bacterium]|jgi:hypothetical protein|nr:T9SS type A sorting domain-containing protein [Bacteroidales bacterium]
MKKIAVLLNLLLILQLLYSQEIYKRIRIPALQILTAARLGIPVEESVVDTEGYFILEVSASEIKQMSEAGINYQVLVENLTQFYVDRNKNQTFSPDNLQTGSIPVPQDFTLGSMGGFCTLSEMENHLDNMASKYPYLITSKTSIGTTHEGRDIYVVKISDNPEIDENETKVLYTGMHHAREPIGMQQMLFFMYHLLENYESNPYIHQLLDTTELYFIPCINPDGYEFNHQYNPQGGGMWRKNRRQNPDNSYGVDLNRNYGYMWGYDDIGSSPNTWSDTYRGPSAFSEPETQAIRDFVLQKSFPLVLNYHSYSNLLLYPWGYIPDTTPDHRIFSQFASKLIMDNAYSSGPSSLTLYSVNGNSDDWMYADPNKPKMFAYTPEVGGQNDGFWPTIDRIIPLCQEHVSANFLVARFAGRYGEIKDLSNMLIHQNTGFIPFSFKRYGLEENATYTVELLPVSSNIISTGNPKNFNNPVLFKTYNDSIAYTLHPSINEGDEVIFLLKLSDGYFTHIDTLVKIYGYPAWIYQSDCNSMTGWYSNKWDITTFFYTSAPASITDSRFGNYGSNADVAIYTTDEIDISDAKAAMVTFNARWETQLKHDFVQFLVSTDNGSSWVPLSGRYTRPSPNPLVDGEPVFDGDQLSWVKEQINLKPFLKKKIKFMFRLRSNDQINKDGFYFDDFKVGTFYETTGIHDFINPARLRVTPNPARISTSIILPADYSQVAGFILTDPTGRLIMKGELTQETHEINIKHFKPGIYHLKVYSEGYPSLSAALVILP